MKRSGLIQRRTPLRRGGPMKRGKRVNPVSAKTAERNQYYQQLRLVWRPDLRPCAGQLEGCYGRGNEVHHRRGRAAAYMLNVGTWSPLCRPCHRHVTDNPAAAEAAGLSESRLAVAEVVDPGEDFCRTCGVSIVWMLDGNRSVPLEAEGGGSHLYAHMNESG